MTRAAWARRNDYVTRTKRLAIYARDGWRCVWCGREADLTLDHLRPLSRGGTHGRRNLVTACKGCNAARQHMSWLTWARDELVVARVRRLVRRKLDYALARDILRGRG